MSSTIISLHNIAKLAIRKVLNIVCDFRSTLYLEILHGYLVHAF